MVDLIQRHFLQKIGAKLKYSEFFNFFSKLNSSKLSLVEFVFDNFTKHACLSHLITMLTGN